MSTLTDISITVSNLSKRFGTTQALEGVNFHAKAGMINAVIGENGAGKSTLMNCLFGLVTPDSGEFRINDVAVPEHYSPADAIQAGLGMLQQHFSLIPVFSVVDNILLGIEPRAVLKTDYATARPKLEQIFRDLDSTISLDSLIENLSVSECQLVEVARMIYTGARLMIFDEPTSSLAPQEIKKLYAHMRRMAEGGATIIVITHRLNEVIEHADTVTVLRRGKVTATMERDGISEESLIAAIVPEGSDISRRTLHSFSSDADPVLTVNGLSCVTDKGTTILRDVSFRVRPGEILGIAGVTGSGQLELAETLAGLRPADKNTILFNNQDVHAARTSRLRKMGLVYVPEDRFISGIILPFSLIHNRLLGDHRKHDFRTAISYKNVVLKDDLQRKIEKYNIKALSTEDPMSALSGGNQQKLMLSREFERKPGLIIAHGPTRGLDVIASTFCYRRLLDLAEAGAAVVLFSTELEDLLSYTHNIAVLHAGEFIPAGASAELTTNSIGRLMTRGRERELAGEALK